MALDRLFVEAFIRCIRQICQHLEYKDLTALCCTNKTINEFLCNPEKSDDIWRDARHKFKTVLYTDPPEGMSERDYARLFSSADKCQCCGRADKRVRIYWIPRVRLCVECLEENSVSIVDINYWKVDQQVLKVTPRVSDEHEFEGARVHYWVPHFLYLSEQYQNLNTRRKKRTVEKWIMSKKMLLQRLTKDAIERHRMLSRTRFSIFCQEERTENVNENDLKGVDPLSIKTYDRVNLGVSPSLMKPVGSTTDCFESQPLGEPLELLAEVNSEEWTIQSKHERKSNKKRLNRKVKANKKVEAQEMNTTESSRRKRKRNKAKKANAQEEPIAGRTRSQTKKKALKTMERLEKKQRRAKNKALATSDETQNPEPASSNGPVTAITSKIFNPIVSFADSSSAGVPEQFNNAGPSSISIQTENILGPAINSKRREILIGLRQCTLTSNAPQGAPGIRTDEPIYEFLPMCHSFKVPPTEHSLWMPYTPPFLNNVIQMIRYEAINMSHMCFPYQRPGNVFTLAGAVAHRFDRYPIFQCKICKLSQVDVIQQVRNHVAVIHQVYEELPSNAIEVNELKLIEYLIEGFNI